MNYAKRNNKVTKLVRRMILLGVLGLSVLFSYEILALLELESYKPSSREEARQERQVKTMAYISNDIYIDRRTSLFAKIWMKGIDQHHQGEIKE